MGPTALHLVTIAAGGALGGIARVWVMEAVSERLGERFQWGTLVVNISGAAAIGVLAAILLTGGNEAARPAPWAGLVVGILGSYTTVSSFSLQTLVLLRAGEAGRAAANVLASLVLCLAAAAAAYGAAGWLVQG